ncbi:MAG: DinB family protein [Acidobacteriota bacterium]|nr:DinB family protein [Acidobacteriota bacterium]
MAENVDRFKKLFDYDFWANQRALESVPTATSQDEALRLMSHIVGAGRVWLGRFQNSSAAPPQPWPKLSLAECVAGASELHAGWAEVLGRADLSGNLIYHNTKGDAFATPVAEVLTHITMHAAYHRGQLAAAVRKGSGAPAVTDYIAYVRQQAKPA